MKSVVIICFGKLKTPGLDASVAEFTKRLGRYVDFKTYELKPLPVDAKSETIRERVTLKESQSVLDLIGSKAFQSAHGKIQSLIAMDESGQALPTLAWSRLLRDEIDAGKTIVFLLGSGLGLHETLLKKAPNKLSFGPQTFSHELARLVLVEQLYRAFSYLEGHPYHNEG